MRLAFAVEDLTTTGAYRLARIAAVLNEKPWLIRDVCPDMREREARLRPLRVAQGPRRMGLIAALVEGV